MKKVKKIRAWAVIPANWNNYWWTEAYHYSTAYQLFRSEKSARSVAKEFNGQAVKVEIKPIIPARRKR